MSETEARTEKNALFGNDLYIFLTTQNIKKLVCVLTNYQIWLLLDMYLHSRRQTKI